MTDSQADAALAASTMRAATLRILPLLMVAFFVSYLDRVNIGFAALQMRQDLGLSFTGYGLALSAFFVSLCLCEVPSNYLMARVGARRWISRILITWGFVSGAMAFSTGLASLVTLRFLVGAAEAGFFPGVILYLSFWFPAAYRAKILSYFLIAIPISNFLGSPISGALLDTEGWLGLHGWQWLFIIEAAPALVLGVVVLFILPDSPATAPWLSATQRDWLTGALAAEVNQDGRVAEHSVWRILTNPRVLGLALIYSGSVGASYALSYWQPTIIKGFGLTNLQTGLVNAIPFGLSIFAVIYWATNSDRTRERVWHTVLPLVLSAAGFVACMYLTALWPVLLALTFALIGSYAVKAPLFALCTESLSAQSSAVGIAQVCALGNVAGLVCPLLIGWMRDLTGSFALGLLPMVVLALVSAAVVPLVRLRTSRVQKRALA